MRFAISQGTLPWQPILRAKSAKSAKRLPFLGLAFHKGLQGGKADGRIDTPCVLSISRKNLVNFGPLLLEFGTVTYFYPFDPLDPSIHEIFTY